MHFKIKTVAGADDYGTMEEVLFRRYQKALAPDHLPDLVLLDGGRGQWNPAQVEGIRAAAEELLRVPGMSRRAAQAVYPFFHPP